VTRLKEKKPKKCQDYQDLFTRFNNAVLAKDSLYAIIQHLQEGNAELRKNEQIVSYWLENLSQRETCVLHPSVEDEL
jgi:hypothetical protein